MAKVTLKDIYEITNRIEDKLDKIEGRVSVLEIWKAELIGKMTVIGGILLLGFNLTWDFLKAKLFKDI
jgi:hypothetical protein